jgi:hypothetical protein
MSDFGTLPVSSTTIGGNNVPVANAFVPGTSGGNMTAPEGLAINTDGNGYKSTALRLGAKDGDIVTTGTKADSAATDNTSSWSLVSILKGVWGFLSTLASTVSGGRIQVSGTFYQATQPVSGTVSVSSLPALTAGTNVIGHVVVDSAGSVTISTLPSLPAGTNVIGHVIVDSASSVSVSALPSLPTGVNAIGSITNTSFTATQATGTNLHTVIDSASNVAVTSLPALASGNNIIGATQIIGNDSSSKLKVNGDGTLPIVQSDQSTSGTLTTAGQSTQFDLKDAVGTVEFFLAGTFSSGSTIVFEQSADNTNWLPIFGRVTGSATVEPISSLTGPGPIAVLCNGVSAAHVRARCTVFQTGDSINITVRSSVGTTAVSIDHSLPPGSAVIGGITQSGTWTVGLSATDATQIASAAFTTTQTGADQTNSAARGVRVVLDVTSAGTGSVTLAIQAKDVASGKYPALLTGTAVTTNSTNVYVVYPALTPSANAVVSDVLPHTWRVVVTANNANSTTYSVGASYLL